jgi:beta-1,4-mannosyltransferase
VIDWHNFGFSFLEVHKTAKPVVQIAQFFKFLFGHWETAHITVTEALKPALAERGIMSVVVRDRPSRIFAPSRDKRERFSKELELNKDDAWIVTSTSWTPDEKIEMLLDAADLLAPVLKRPSVGLSIIITGKGPGRRSFECEVKTRQFANISFMFHFFEKCEDDASFGGCCDAGVSLYVSSSGVELPMKGLDMLGAGLPLLSVTYGCIGELVEDKVNELLFRNARDLAEMLRQLFVTKEIKLGELQDKAIAAGATKWEDVWSKSAKHVLVANA